MRFIRADKAGFTLLETLIAFSVFSLFMIAVHKTFVSGLKGQETASWSNMTGLAVLSEFAQIEAGLARQHVYWKELDAEHRLEVEISELSLDQISVPVSRSGIFEAKVKVKNLKDDSEQVFTKVVYLQDN